MSRLQPKSITTKLVVLTVFVCVFFIWTLAHIAVAVLQDHFDEVLLEQQYAATQQFAEELDIKLRERVEYLTRAATFVPSDLHPEALDRFLAQRTSLHVTFSGGIAVIGLDGVTIADFPVASGRRGTYFGDREYFRQVIATRKPFIDKPIMGRALQHPVLTIAVPVLDASGKIRAVITGITDLHAPNFLGAVTQPRSQGAGEYFIVAKDHRLIVAATDNTRSLTRVTERGLNPTFDRFIDGFEGSGFGVSSRGIPKLYSGRQLREANWIVLAALPADIARRPMLTMQRYVYIASTALTLLAVIVIWWVTRRVLAPLENTGQAIRRMTAGGLPLSPIPIPSDDEVGQLIRDFNRLVSERQRYESERDAVNKELHAFTYAASHDMKAPLGRITNFSELLERDYRDRLEGNGLLFLDLIRRNGKRLVVLVDDLLVHAEFGQQGLVLEPVNLRQKIEKVIAEFDDEIRAGSVEIRRGVSDVSVLAAPHAIAQVLRNLLENALKYSAAANPPVVEIGNRVSDGKCQVWVKDNGIGFDMTYHDRIFEVLRRLHTYEEFPGSGVGLALVKKAMEHMGGRVWANSTPGMGATFFLEFPVAPPATNNS